MNQQLKHFLMGFFAIAAGVAVGATFNQFSPATGVLKGNSSSYITTAAVSADIRGLWSGTCDATTFLRGDGACAFAVVSPAGANTQIQFNNAGAFGASSLLTWQNPTLAVGVLDTMVVNGATITSQLAVNSDGGTSVEAHSHSNAAAQGPVYYWARSRGTTAAPLVVASGDRLGGTFTAGYDGTDFALGASMLYTVGNTPGANDMPTDLDFSLSADGSQTPTSRLKLFHTGAFGVSGSEGTSGQVLTSAGTGAPAAWATLPGSFTGFANPTASVGLTAVNGAATTAMRSDAAPALSQSIAPTWTGIHLFNGATNTTSIGTSGISPGIRTTNPTIQFTHAGMSVNTRVWEARTGGAGAAGTWSVAALDDTLATARVGLQIGRTSGAIANLLFGNSTDNPSFSFQGTGNITTGGQILAPDGLVGAPSYSFTGDPDTGLYRVTTNAFRATSGGTVVMTFEPTAATMNVPLLSQDGTAGAPSLSFSADTTMGVYRFGVNRIGFATGGTYRGSFSSTFFDTDVPVYAADGTVGSPAYTFDADTDTGVFRQGTNSMGLTANGVNSLNVAVSGANSSITIGATSSSSLSINNTVSATANVGGIVPPVTVSGYITVVVNGTTVKIPYYAN